jgi:hypothetical protein
MTSALSSSDSEIKIQVSAKHDFDLNIAYLRKNLLFKHKRKSILK